jgi:hypothetical protein
VVVHEYFLKLAILREADIVAGSPPDSSSTLVVLGVAIIIPFLMSTVRPTVEAIEGKRVLEYGRPLKIFVLVFWGFVVVVFAVALRASVEELPIAFALVGGFILLILPLHLEFFYVRIEYDDAGIRTRSPWRRNREIPWSAVTSAWYSQAAQWYVLETTGFGRVRLHTGLNGLESILSELESRGIPVKR